MGEGLVLYLTTCVGAINGQGEPQGKAQTEVSEPPRADRVPWSADRLGQCALRVFGKRLDKQLDSAGKGFVNKQSGMVSPTDLAEAAEMIPAAVQWRLHRLAALIRLLREEEAKARPI